MNRDGNQGLCGLSDLHVLCNEIFSCHFASEGLVVPESDGAILFGACEDQRSLDGDINRRYLARVEALTHEIKLDFLFKNLVKSNGLRQNLADVVILERNSQVVVTWRAIETEDLNSFSGTWLPLSYTVICGLSRSCVVFFRSDPKGHVSAIGCYEKAFGIRLDKRHVHVGVSSLFFLGIWNSFEFFEVSEGVINLLLLIVVKEDDLSILRTNYELVVIEPGVVRIVSILLNSLELGELFETTLIDAPDFPMIRSRSTNEVPVIRVE